MFQSGRLRQDAWDHGLCPRCKKRDTCVFKDSLVKDWRFVLGYCQLYEKDEDVANGPPDPAP